jgi:hypothetical protein
LRGSPQQKIGAILPTGQKSRGRRRKREPGRDVFDFPGCSFKGTNTNDNAAAGFYGEIVSSEVLIASEVGLTTATATNITSISLTAGDWDVRGNISFDETASTLSTRHSAAVNDVSATNPTVPGKGGINIISHAGVAVASTSQFVLPTGVRRFSLATTTTIYLVARAVFPA